MTACNSGNPALSTLPGPLYAALTEIAPLLNVCLDGTEDMPEHLEALAGLERARGIVAAALRGEA